MRLASIVSSTQSVISLLAGFLVFGFLITLGSAIGFQIARNVGLLSESPSFAMAVAAPFLGIALTGWIAPNHKLVMSRVTALYIALFLTTAFYRSATRAGWEKAEPSYHTLVFIRYLLDVVGIGLGVVWSNCRFGPKPLAPI